MMLQLLHGPAVSISRVKLTAIKDKFDPDSVVVFENGSDIKTILGQLATTPLLGEEQLFILENPPEDFIGYTLSPAKSTLILWFDHEVGQKKPIMEWVKGAKGQILFFPQEREVGVFGFLDDLANKDRRAFLKMAKLKDAGFDIHYFISMVYYLLRNLTATPPNAHPYVKKKLEGQRKNFSLAQLKNLYQEVLEIDYKLKSGLLDSLQAEFLLNRKFID